MRKTKIETGIKEIWICPDGTISKCQVCDRVWRPMDCKPRLFLCPRCFQKDWHTTRIYANQGSEYEYYGKRLECNCGFSIDFDEYDRPPRIHWHYATIFGDDDDMEKQIPQEFRAKPNLKYKDFPWQYPDLDGEQLVAKFEKDGKRIEIWRLDEERSSIRVSFNHTKKVIYCLRRQVKAQIAELLGRGEQY